MRKLNFKAVKHLPADRLNTEPSIYPSHLSRKRLMVQLVVGILKNYAGLDSRREG
jgi:hypothetical protein